MARATAIGLFPAPVGHSAMTNFTLLFIERTIPCITSLCCGRYESNGKHLSMSSSLIIVNGNSSTSSNELSMSKVLMTADFHFGLHGKTKDILMAAQSIRNYAHRNDITHVFVLGDLFHDRESTNVEVGHLVYEFLKSAKEEYGQEWYVFPGNHDMYFKYNWKITTLRPYSDVCHVLEDIHRVDVYDRRFWMVPFIAVDKAYMDVIDELDKDSKQSDVLLTHIGCIGASYNLCFLFQEQKAINFDHRVAGQVFTGHFHCYHRAGVKTHYTGSPIAFSFDEGVVPHGFIEYDCDTGKHDFVDLRPLMKADFPGQMVPPDMVTIGFDSVPNLTSDDMLGNCFRIVSDQYIPDELATQYRKDLMSNGAKIVRFIRLKDSLEPEVNRASAGVSRMQAQDLFTNFFGRDPHADKYNRVLMYQLNSEIVHEGDSLYTVENVGID